MVDFADLAKPVAASVLLGLSSGWLARVSQVDVLPFALATLLVILLTAVAQVLRSRGLARAARAAAAAVAAWFLAEVLARLGAPPYAAIPLAPLFYRFVFAPASVLGDAFGAHVGPAFTFAALVASALDVLLVYRTRLFVASASLNGATEEMSARFRTFTLGFADFFYYSIAVAAAGLAKAPLTALAIYAGLAATARLAEGRGYAPALPLPLTLAVAVHLAPIP